GYKAGKYDDALASFGQIPAGGEDSNRTARLAYNVGNTKFRQGEAAEAKEPQKALGLWAEALVAYRRALGADPDDVDAKFNHELVERKIAALRKKLEEQQKQKDQQQQDQQQQDQQQKDGQQDQQQSNGEQKDDQQQGEQGQQEQRQDGSQDQHDETAAGEEGDQKKPGEEQQQDAREQGKQAGQEQAQDETAHEGEQGRPDAKEGGGAAQ